MILLTGATGLVGSVLLRRLTARGDPVRVLVRDPRRLGPERVRVQIALGDLADPASFRHAMRGVQTVVHLAASVRDQPRGSIEELNGVATWRMVTAAERVGVEHFIFFTPLNASSFSPARIFRAKALAEKAVLDSGVRHTVFASSLVYSPGEAWLRVLERFALLPALPVSGRGLAPFQPIWAEDVADCVLSVMDGGGDGRPRHELAGPETIPQEEVIRIALRSFGKPRPLLNVPLPVVRRALRTLELLAGPTAFATEDEAELLQVGMTTPSGTRDAEGLGVIPKPMGAVLGA